LVETEAPSELLMRGSNARPAASASSAKATAASASIVHGCHWSKSRDSRAMRASSASPFAVSGSVCFAMAQAISTVRFKLSGLRSAVLALAFRWPK
jgi:hypothetical protein